MYFRVRKVSRSVVLALAASLVLMYATPVRAEESLDLAEYSGKVVLLDFWASWCVPCRRSFPWMNRMQQEYGDNGLVIIGVNMNAEPGPAQAFLDDYPAEFRIIYDPDGELAREYNVIAMPSSYVIGRDGLLAARHLGFKVRSQDEYESVLLEALRTGRE